MQRRTLFKSVVAGGVAASSLAQPAGSQPASPLPPLPKLSDPGERRGDMLYRKLGRTGESISAIGFGGPHFAKPTIAQAESIRLIANPYRFSTLCSMCARSSRA